MTIKIVQAKQGRVVRVESKMSGTGTIHDIAWEGEDMDLRIPKGGYAVLTAAYFNISPSIHRTEWGTIHAAKRLHRCGHAVTIIDHEAKTYIYEPYYGLVPCN